MDEQAKAAELIQQWRHLFRKDGDKAQQAEARLLWTKKVSLDQESPHS